MNKLLRHIMTTQPVKSRNINHITYAKNIHVLVSKFTITASCNDTKACSTKYIYHIYGYTNTSDTASSKHATTRENASFTINRQYNLKIPTIS